MSRESMYMNSDNMKAIASQLKEKIDQVESCYSNIRKSVKNIDGTNDNWKGDNQMKFYNYYFNLSKAFPENVKKLNDFYYFLVNTIKSYEERDKDIDKDIDNNADNLKV